MSNHRCCKPLLIALCAILLFADSKAQNLISNADFEQYTICPSTVGQLSRCVGWIDYNSADYFNACSTGDVSVPVNRFGYQMAASGSAYVGFNDYLYSNIKEYVGANISPLQIGVTYQVSLYISLRDGANYGTDDVGIFFFNNNSNVIANTVVMQVTPQVFFSLGNPITDTINWIRVRGKFTADSAYTHLVIGGFKPDNQLKKNSCQTFRSLYLLLYRFSSPNSRYNQYQLY